MLMSRRSPDKMPAGTRTGNELTLVVPLENVVALTKATGDWATACCEKTSEPQISTPGTRILKRRCICNALIKERVLVNSSLKILADAGAERHTFSYGFRISKRGAA